MGKSGDLAAPEHQIAASPKASVLQKGKMLTPFKAGNVRLIEMTNSTWRAVAPRGLSHSDLEQPAVWAGVDGFHAYDRVEAVATDRTWWAELLVVVALPGFTLMRTLRVIELPDQRKYEENGVPKGYDIRPADLDDQQGGWLVERLSDNNIMATGLADFEAARRYLHDHASLRRDANPTYVP